MPATAAAQQANSWLLEHGPGQLESLFRAIVYHPSAPILIADDERRHRDASARAGKLLGFPREKIIGRTVNDFTGAGHKPRVAEIWRDFLDRGVNEGKLTLVDANGASHEISYSAKGNVLPARHLLVLRRGHVPAWVRDYALFLLNEHGKVAAWYAGAERILWLRQHRYGWPPCRDALPR